MYPELLNIKTKSGDTVNKLEEAYKNNYMYINNNNMIIHIFRPNNRTRMLGCLLMQLYSLNGEEP